MPQPNALNDDGFRDDANEACINDAIDKIANTPVTSHQAFESCTK